MMTVRFKTVDVDGLKTFYLAIWGKNDPFFIPPVATRGAAHPLTCLRTTP